MAHWNSSPHPISDIRDWKEAGRLELRPDFQRLEVWSSSARIMLIDTILRDIPMPKIFLASTIRESRTYRVVIDGQQRLSAILAFMRDEFALDPPFAGPEIGQRFSDLAEETQNRFLSYSIDFNEAQNPSEKEVREVYSRVNKYTVALNKQELRRADYPGDFLRLCEELALDPRLEQFKLFTPADRRRYADVEYVSELLAVTLGGIQNGKSALDDFYRDFIQWDRHSMGQTKAEIENILKEMEIIFDPETSIAGTRFHQKADFYSFFTSILGYVRSGVSAGGKTLKPLREDFEMLDYNIRPESGVTLCREYAIKCVSQANSAASRKWRTRFMTALLDGTYIGKPLGKMSAELYYSLQEDFENVDSGFCEPHPQDCALCEAEIGREERVLAWWPETQCFQVSNSCWIHRSCSVSSAGWTILERPDPNGQLYFL